MKHAIAFAMVLTLVVAARADVVIVVDRNLGAAATHRFDFARVPSPSPENAATHARIDLIAGRIDRASPGLTAINDGVLPAVEDDPSANLFFAAGTWGGRFRIDFNAVVPVAQIDTYSWHSDSRAAQLYKVYGSDGTAPHFNAAPGNKTDPASCGWTLIAFVDTRPHDENTGGQYGVAIRDTSGVLGRYRYLLFDCFETEDHDWSNTFYSEVDVRTAK